VCRAISVAARLVSEKLQATANTLIELLLAEANRN
jgi:hypothetical protein